uniref:BRCT domain-containing protein n=1 Tax=Mycena chlorophos TaxID=658473 RepID=A0ABQ0LQ94_MYCCL|nr:predicted protein [Mycena chlorophos]
MAVDSQASVIIRAALLSDPEQATGSSDALDASNDVSSHSFGVDRNPPEYHYHGLATTQSEESGTSSLSKHHDGDRSSDVKRPMVRTHEGTVLVAPTPTPSLSELRSQSPEEDEDEESQPNDFRYPAPLPEPSQPSQASSSDPCPDLYTKLTPPCANPTPEEYQCSPTQLCTQEDLEPTQLVATQAVEFIPTQLVQSPPPPPNVVPAGPRSLLDSLGADKRARYAIRDEQPANDVWISAGDWQQSRGVLGDSLMHGQNAEGSSSGIAQKDEPSDMETEPDVVPESLMAPKDVKSLREEEEESEQEEEREQPPPKRVRREQAKSKTPAAKKAKRRSATKSTASTSTTRSRKKGGKKKTTKEPETDLETVVTEQGDQEDYSEPTAESGRKRKRASIAKQPEQRRTSPPPPPVELSVTRTTRSKGTAQSDKKAEPSFLVWARCESGDWYPARIISIGRQYTVQFNDSRLSNLPLTKLRVYSLQRNDEVIWGNVAHCVVDAAHFPRLVVEHKASGQQVAIDAAVLHLHHRVVTAWGSTHNVLKPTDIVLRDLCAAAPAVPNPPIASVSVASEASAASKPKPKSTSQKPLVGITFSFSAAPSAVDDGWREKTTRIIKKAGGTVIESWDNVIATVKKPVKRGLEEWEDDKLLRYVLHAEDVVVDVGKSDLLFLLCREFCTTPKFLTALALGIPVLYPSIVNDAIEKKEFPGNWSEYLLPGGTSDHVDGGTVSQFVACDLPAYDVKNLWSLKTAFKPFKDASILCVGAEVFEEKEQVPRAIPGMLLAMGASQVEVVAKYQSKKSSPKSYTWIVAATKLAQSDMERDGFSSFVTWDWVKDILIARVDPFAEARDDE